MEQSTQFDLASKTVIQILTLASAILAVSVTFAKDHIFKEKQKGVLAIKISWAFLFVSILFGAGCLMALTGQASSESPSIWAGNITVLAGTQIVTFIISLGCMMWAAWASLGKNT